MEPIKHQVSVIVGNRAIGRDANIAMVKQALGDEMFVRDLREVGSAFAAVDSEGLQDNES